ncbi:MAG TPA: hypothetical protein VKT82_23270 [Ktedonobacterales bacterium]|nr:hypothetical protein [Ktedonobacterales bacterium]
MDKPAITKGRRHVTFSTSLVSAPPPEPERITPLTLVLGFSEGRSLSVDFSSEQCEQVARELLSALAAICKFGNRINTSGSAFAYVQTIHIFLRFLKQRHLAPYNLLSVTQFSKEDIDAFEDYLRACAIRESSNTPYRHMNRLVLLLREWMRLFPHPVSDSLRERLVYSVNGGIGKHQPRNGYSPLVAEAIRTVCKKEIPRIVQRITVEGEELLALGQDPEVDGWKKPQNVLWAIAQHGMVASRNVKPPLQLKRLYPLLYPSLRDLVPFWVLLTLTTDIPIESLKDLKIDCLKNATKDSVEVRYLKRRAHGHEWQTVRVRDGGIFTPGGLIRLLIKITQRIRTHLNTDVLCLGFYNSLQTSLLHIGRGLGSPIIKRFTLDHDLRDEQGKPLELHLTRLRKTRRAERYVATQGNLEDFSGTIHTLAVAGDHYGDIPALRQAHEDTIERALQVAYREATSTILTPADEQELLLDPAKAPERLGIATQQVAEILTGEHDLWLASCKDFFDSPFGTRGTGCPVPYWGCLDCPNAVITSRKLPAILAFLNFLVRERDVLPEVEWAARFGHSFQRIVHQILPAFPEAIIASARAIAASQEDLIYLPPNLQTLRHLQ